MSNDTAKPQAGTWTLTAPDGRTWRAESPLRCLAAEQRERIPPHIALERLSSEQASAAEEYMPCGHHVSLLVRSVESDYQFCDLCECRKARNDAEQMERHYRRELAAMKAKP